MGFEGLTKLGVVFFLFLQLHICYCKNRKNIFDKPGVAGPVLQTQLLQIHRLGDCTWSDFPCDMCVFLSKKMFIRMCKTEESARGQYTQYKNIVSMVV